MPSNETYAQWKNRVSKNPNFVLVPPANEVEIVSLLSNEPLPAERRAQFIYGFRHTIVYWNMPDGKKVLLGNYRLRAFFDWRLSLDDRVTPLTDEEFAYCTPNRAAGKSAKAGGR